METGEDHETSMKTYFSTFVTGTQEIIKRFLVRRGVKIKLLLDGLVVYDSNYPEREIRNFPVFNNTYLLIRSFGGLEPNAKSLEKMLTLVAGDKDLFRRIAANIPERRRKFKIVSSLENRMIPVDRDLLKKIESIILKVEDVKLDIKKPNLEFWALLRREGHGFFGIRMTYPFGNDNVREKGELRKEISYIMIFVSGPNPKDVVLDPFSGYGSIPIERAKNFPYKEIIAMEKDPQLFSKLNGKIRSSKAKIKVICGDALAMDQIRSGSIDKIISDPPWGEYEKLPNLESFYGRMLEEFKRVLKASGTVTLLIGAKETFEKVLKTGFTNVFVLEEKYEILVSGKKAAIYRLSTKDEVR